MMMERICFTLICSLQLLLVNCHAQVPGCTDPLANNFDQNATENDGTCTYDLFAVSPISSSPLSTSLAETSGLIVWDHYVWTHNDNADTTLYGLDTLSAEIVKEFPLAGIENVGWEEISQDTDYLYLGDFGNNLSGNRTDLRILRIGKESLQSGDAKIDTLWFSYSDQTDLNPGEPNQTNYDCEAMVVLEDSIYLFTKQWLSEGTSVYSLPKLPGTYMARLKSSYDVEGLVTGATCLGSERLMVLSGYTSLLNPFFYLFYDFKGHDFLSGNKRRVTVSLPFHQIEGIATVNGLKYYVSNESFVYGSYVNKPQKLHVFDLGDLLQDYLLEATSVKNSKSGQDGFHLYPNPATHVLYVKADPDLADEWYEIIDPAGRKISSGRLSEPVRTSGIDIDGLSMGIYFIRIGSGERQVTRSFVVE